MSERNELVVEVPVVNAKTLLARGSILIFVKFVCSLRD